MLAVMYGAGDTYTTHYTHFICSSPVVDAVLQVSLGAPVFPFMNPWLETRALKMLFHNSLRYMRYISRHRPISFTYIFFAL